MKREALARFKVNDVVDVWRRLQLQSSESEANGLESET